METQRAYGTALAIYSCCLASSISPIATAPTSLVHLPVFIQTLSTAGVRSTRHLLLLAGKCDESLSLTLGSRLFAIRWTEGQNSQQGIYGENINKLVQTSLALDVFSLSISSRNTLCRSHDKAWCWEPQAPRGLRVRIKQPYLV